MRRSRRHKLALVILGALIFLPLLTHSQLMSPPAAGGTAGVRAGQTASPAALTPPASGTTVAPLPGASILAATTAKAPAFLPKLAGNLTQGTIRITTAIDRTVIRVGDLIHYSLVIAAPPGSKIAMPPPGAQLGMFLIRDYHFPGVEEKKVKWSEDPLAYLRQKLGLKPKGVKEGEQEFHFTITAYETGDLVIPPFPVLVMDPTGAQHALYAESARVRVVPVTSPEDLTIKDIKAPRPNPVPVVVWLPYLLVPVLLLGLLGLGLWLWKRRKKEEAEILALRPAHEIALEELSALEQEGLLEAGEYEKFYTRLSWILRKYLALRFHIYALEYTTTEILNRLKTADIDHADYERVRDFLTATDLVKFGRHEPDLSERNAIFPAAREIVERTKKEPVVETEKEAA